jgi:hypothetical protein
MTSTVKVQGSRFKVQGSRFKVQGSRFKVQGSRFKVQSSRFKVQSSRFKVQGSRFKVQGSRFKVQGSRFKVQGSRFKVQSSKLKVQSSKLKVQGSKFKVCIRGPGRLPSHAVRAQAGKPALPGFSWLYRLPKEPLAKMWLLSSGASRRISYFLNDTEILRSLRSLRMTGMGTFASDSQVFSYPLLTLTLSPAGGEGKRQELLARAIMGEPQAHEELS